ncbi:MAG: hypothetical protein ACRC0V_11640, partial [Fusobacteriaceae bacterium]
PDISKFTSVEEFEEYILKNNSLNKKTTYKDILIDNFHTPFIFTNVGTENNPLWTDEAQPIISFNNSHLPLLEEKEKKEKVKIDNKEEIKGLKKSIETSEKYIEKEAKKNEPNIVVIEQYQEDIEDNKAKLQKLEQEEVNFDKELAKDILKEDIVKKEMTQPRTGVKELFEANSELASIGTQEEYSQYLDTIFPNTKVKDIVYHGSPNFGFDSFSKEKLGEYTGSASAKLGFFFSNNVENSLYGYSVNIDKDVEFDDDVELPASVEGSFGLSQIYAKIKDLDDGKDFIVFEESGKEYLIKSIEKSGGVSIGLPFKTKKEALEDYKRDNPHDKKEIEILERTVNTEKYRYSKVDWLKDKPTNYYREDKDSKILISKKEFEEERDKVKEQLLIEKDEYIKEQAKSRVFNVLLNVKDLKETDDFGSDYRTETYVNRTKQAWEENKDGLVIRNTYDPLLNDVYIVFEPEQIHILGNEQDINRFKNFIKQSQINLEQSNFNHIKQQEFGNNDIIDINNEILYKTLSRIKVTSSFNKKKLLEEIIKVYEELEKDLLDKSKFAEAKFLSSNRDNILGISQYDGSVKEMLDVLFDLAPEEELTFASYFIKDFSKESFEHDIKTSVSLKVKILLAGIKDSRISEKGFAGFSFYMPFSQTLYALQEILSEVNNNTLEEVELRIKDKIKYNPVEFGFYQEILDRLKELEKEENTVINEVLYFLYQSTTEMCFVMHSKDESNNFKIEKNNADSKNPAIVKRQKWNQSFRNSPLIEKFEEGFYRIKPDVANKVIKLYEDIQLQKKQKNVNINTVKEYLSYFGIQLATNTLEKLKDNLFGNAEMSLYTIDPDTKGEYGITAANQIVDLLHKNLNEGLKTQNGIGKIGPKILAFSHKHVDDVKKQAELNLLITNTTKALKILIKADNLMSFNPVSSVYIAGKTINAYQQPKRITNILRKLKREKKYRDQITKTATMSKSFVVEMLNKNLDFRDYFNVINASLEALKKLGEVSTQKEKTVVSLSDKDSFITLFGLFAHNDGKIKDSTYETEKGISLRKGVMPFPTLSDSSQTPLLMTVLIDLQLSNFEPGSINKLNDNILTFLLDKLIAGDLERISQYLKSGGVNIKGHNAGAAFIASMPSLNTLLIETKDINGKDIKRPLIDVFSNYGEEGTPHIEDINSFIKKYNREIKDEIQRNLDSEVSELISKDGKKGLLVRNGIYTEDNLNFIDNKYLESKGKMTTLAQANLLSYDYIINSMLQQKEIQNLFAGDVANYFKDGMGKNLSFSLPSVDIEDLIGYYYPSMSENNRKQIKLRFKEKLIIDHIKEHFPKLLAAQSISLLPLEEKIEIIIPIAKLKTVEMFKDVHDNLAKRLKALISPGNQEPNSKGNRKYYQVMLSDVESASEVLDSLVKQSYPEKYEEIKGHIKEFKKLDNIYENERTDIQKERHSNLLKSFQKGFPLIGNYFKTVSTDAQEYNTWRDNLNLLKNKSIISKEEFKKIHDKLVAQDKDIIEKGDITEENKWKESEKELKSKAIMQPTKPLYSGVHFEEVNGYSLSRDVYIKSSTFTLLPELTALSPKLERLRRNLESLEKYDKEGLPEITVRASYDSANKVGAVKNSISINELYKDKVNKKLLSEATVELDKSNFFIQQDKPFHSDENAEKGKEDRTLLATQFEKILLGDGISKIEEEVFPNIFDEELLAEIGIEYKEKVSGKTLKKLYEKLYEKQQKLLKDKLFRKFGITDYKDIAEGKVEAMEKIVDLLNKRLTNKQDREALELIYVVDINGINSYFTKKEISENEYKVKKAIFKLPLPMMPNSHKFESVLNSIINKNSINLTLPGFSLPVASQEGFDFKGYGEDKENALKELKRKGLITTKKFDPKKGLQATVNEEGELQYAQVFMASKLKVFNKETRQYDYVDLREYVDENGLLDTDRIPSELLSFFSFRIPTSSHQSGVIVEIVGFLPHTCGDLLIVPKDHTIQMGEDYDIDTRYFYNYHYIKNNAGKLERIKYSDLGKENYRLLQKEYFKEKDKLFKQYFIIDEKEEKIIYNPLLICNKELLVEIAILENAIQDNQLDTIYTQDLENELNRSVIKQDLENRIIELRSKIIPNSIIDKKNEELKKEFHNLLESLKKEFNSDTKLKESYNNYMTSIRGQEKQEQVLENNIVSLYKSVFSSTDTRVQSLINKVLSTDNAENTANKMDKKIQDSKKTDIYNIYSPNRQREIAKSGNAGKIGTGEHSNAVAMNSLFQQSDFEHKLIESVKLIDDKEVETYFHIHLGNQVFDGIMGKIENNGTRISELAMESQNSSVDNQKLHVMWRRNENEYTMSVLKILQANGIDNDGIKVNGETLSYSSLFINQPILRRYAEIMERLNSSTENVFGDTQKQVKNILLEEFGGDLEDSWQILPNDVLGGEDIILYGELRKEVKEKAGKTLTTKELWDNILEEDMKPLQQWTIFESFLELKKAASKYSDLQQFVNIEKNGMDISYFNVIALKQRLVDLSENKIKNVTNEKALFGDFKNISSTDEFLGESLIDEGYIKISENDTNDTILFIKPNNHYAHKIINSIASGYNMYNSLFPYDKGLLSSIISDIEESAIPSKDLETKYKIMSSLKDFIYSASREIFDNNRDKIVDSLFFDNNKTGSVSFASYLLNLSNNKDYKRLFNNPFFKDLQFNINEGGYPSLLIFNN